MKYSESIKPISYLKAHASEIVNDIADTGKTLVITQHGEARAVLQDVESYEQTQESLAMLKILALSTASQKRGKVKTVATAFRSLRARIGRSM